MTRVRIYFHSGFEPPPAKPGAPRQPYLDRCIMDVGFEAKTSTPAPKGTTVALVQADGLVHIEIRPLQDQRPADIYSPMIEGDMQFIIGADWTVSVLEVGAVADIPFDLPEAAQ
jgi:hypothetical protein